MPGPIETAFVDIIARLSFEQQGAIEDGIRRGVAQAERDFDRLENKASEVGREIAARLGGVRIQLNVREAIGSVDQLGHAVDTAVGDLRALNDVPPLRFSSALLKRDIDALDNSFKKLAAEFKSVDGETITVNVATAETRIKEVTVNVQTLLAALGRIARSDVQVDVAPAIAALRLVSDRAAVALKEVRALGEGVVTVRVDDIGIPRLEEQLHEISREISEVSGKSIHPNVAPATAAMEELDRRTAHVGDTFERVGKRLLAFAVFGGVTAGISQLVRSGIQAAAAIETVQTSLDRLFKGFATAGQQLGGTSTQFFAALRQLALTTPFQVKDLGTIAARIVQIRTNLNEVADAQGNLSSRSQIAVDRLRAVADAGAAIGATSDDLNGVVSAIQKIGARSTVTLLGLNQISQRLPDFGRQLQIESIIAQLNKVRPGLNATVADFDKLRKDGLIPTTIAVDGLFEGMKKIPGAAGAAAAQARTLTGALSNLKDFATLEFADAFASAGVTIADNLNKAFSQTSIKTPLSRAIEEVISSAGVATQKALPAVLDFVVKVSSKISDAVTAIGKLTTSLASGFGGNLFAGVIVGLTNVIDLITAVNQLLSHLPAAVGESLGQFLTLSTVLSQLSGGRINVLGLVIDQVKNIGLAALQATFGVVALRDAIISISASSVLLAAIAAAFIAVQQFLGDQTKAARWSKDFQESINAATKSLKDFEDVGSATEDFIKKFAEAGNAVKLGELSKFFDGLTSTQIETNLGLSQKALADFVATAAEFGSGSSQAADKARELGINFDALKQHLSAAEFSNTVVNLASLSDQLARAAPAAFDAAVAQKTFNFVTDDATGKIVAVARATGDYIGGLKQLQAANNLGAQAELASVVALNKISDAQKRQIIANATSKDGTVDYTKAVADLRQKLKDLDAAFLDVLDKAPPLGSLLQSVSTTFTNLTSGSANARSNLLDFAESAGEAKLSAQELDAVAQKLGTNLTGTELGDQLALITKDFTDTAAALVTSLPAFGDAVTAAFSGVKVDAALTGLDKIQATFDQFSLTHFIDELNRVVDARVNLVTNLNTLADLSAEAVRRLFDLKLDPTQLAVVVKSLDEGGQSAVDAFLAPFHRSDELTIGAGNDLVRKLVEAGINPALLAAIPGLTDNVNSAINTALKKVEPNVNERALIDAAVRGGGAPVPSIPGVDVEAAKTQATTAGDQVGKAFGDAAAASFPAGMAEATKAVLAQINLLGPLGGISALAGGKTIGLALSVGVASETDNLRAHIIAKLLEFGPASGLALAGLGKLLSSNMVEALNVELVKIQTVINDGLNAAVAVGSDFTELFGGLGKELASRLVKAFDTELSVLGKQAFALGLPIGEELGRGVVAGLQAQMEAILAAGAAVTLGAAAAAGAAAGVHSPSTVFAEIGRELARGLAAGIRDATWEPVKAVGATVNALVGAAAAPAASSAARSIAAASSAASPSIAAPAWSTGPTSIFQNTSQAAAPEHVAIAVDARGSGGDYWSGMEVGRGVADQWHAYRLRFPKK